MAPKISVKDFLATSPISIKEIARRSGISYGRVRHYSGGLRKPGPVNTQRIKKAVVDIALELLKTNIYAS